MKKKILASILAAVTMATCAFSAVACNKDIPQEDEVASSVQEEVKDSGNLAVEDVTPTPGMRLNVKRLSTNYTGSNSDAGIATVAEDLYQLTAMVLPIDAADKTVTYSVAWSNANSTWANGKMVTDYVTVTQTSTGSLTATATCKQAFGEPIVVTVTSNSNPEAKATATLHYKQKIEKIQLLEQSGYVDALCDVTEYGDANEEQLSGFLNVDFNKDLGGAQLHAYIAGGSVYTRENQDVGSVHITPTVDFCAVLDSLGIPIRVTTNEYGTIYLDDLPSKVWFEKYGTTPAKKNEIINALCAFDDVAYTAVISVSGSFSEQFNISLNTDVIATQKLVESVELQDTEVEF